MYECSLLAGAIHFGIGFIFGVLFIIVLCFAAAWCAMHETNGS